MESTRRDSGSRRHKSPEGSEVSENRDTSTSSQESSSSSDNVPDDRYIEQNPESSSAASVTGHDRDSSTSSSGEDEESDEHGGARNLMQDTPNEGIITVRVTPVKPVMSFQGLQTSRVASILPEFLSQMDSANKGLAAEEAAGTEGNHRIEMDGASDGEEYIEMNLGLGVLEELKSTEEESDVHQTTDSEVTEDVMGMLLGRKRKGEEVASEEDDHRRKKKMIEEVAESS